MGERVASIAAIVLAGLAVIAIVGIALFRVSHRTEESPSDAGARIVSTGAATPFPTAAVTSTIAPTPTAAPAPTRTARPESASDRAVLRALYGATGGPH